MLVIVLLNFTIHDFLQSSSRAINCFQVYTLTWPRLFCVQILYNTLVAYHMHHVCHVVQRDSSVIGFNGVEIVFILSFLFLWLKPLTTEGVEET